MKTDQSVLQASFVYDDEKVKLEDVQQALDSKSRGRYKATVVQTPK